MEQGKQLGESDVFLGRYKIRKRRQRIAVDVGIGGKDGLGGQAQLRNNVEQLYGQNTEQGQPLRARLRNTAKEQNSKAVYKRKVGRGLEAVGQVFQRQLGSSRELGIYNLQVLRRFVQSAKNEPVLRYALRKRLV